MIALFAKAVFAWWLLGVFVVLPTLYFSAVADNKRTLPQSEETEES